MSSGKTKTGTAPSGYPARSSPPNDQGKGQVGFLLDWHYSGPRAVVAKPAPQLLADYFTSLLVLSAAFKFKPVFGREYFLYVDGSGWSLSLVSPDEWNDEARREAFVATCVLHDDSTWSIAPSDNVGRAGSVDEALAAFYEGFADKLRSGRPLEADLPLYAAGLPYYQRLFAAALSRSLKASLTRGGQLGEAGRSWLERMPRDATRLLRSSGDG